MTCRMARTNIEVRPSGKVSPCCVSDFVSDSTIQESSISEIVQESQYQEFVSDIESGVKRDECRRCWDIENSGGESKRMMENKRPFESMDLTVIKSLDIKPGNVCNLKCRICSSYASSRWIPDEKKLSGFSHFPKFDWAESNPEALAELVDLSEHVEYIEFSGGEPFLIAAQWKFIENLVHSNRAPNIHLQYHTNGTIFPTEHQMSLLQQFKKCTIALSIDGQDEKFEYQRHPANWAVVHDNWKKFKDSGLHVTISHSVSTLNILDLPDFIYKCSSLDTEVYINLVDNMFPIAGLSDWTKYRVIDVLDTNLPTDALTQVNPATKNDNWLSTIMLDSLGNNNNQQYLDSLEKLDQIRNESYETTFPEMSRLLKQGK